VLNLKRYLDIRGSSIVNRIGEEKGVIDDCIFDYKSKRVCSLIAESKSIFPHFYAVKFEDIKNIEHVLICDGKLYEIDKGVLNRNKKYMLHSFIDREIIDPTGKAMGEMKDALIDEDNGIIKAIICSRGFIEDMFEGRKVVMINENTIFGPDKIIVSDNFVDMYNDMSIWKMTRG
jgi:uncharacterized protein YrrD